MTESITQVGSEMRSYYGRPVIKEPVWKPEIPAYFFTGGLGGAAAVLGQIARRRREERLADCCVWLSAGADAASALLLISDLGRPERFHHMLRTFKVTSPMSVGSWLLAFAGTTSGATAVAQLVAPRRLRDRLEGLSALFGLPLATYTAVLISDTAVPVWHEARHELPFVFGTSGAASAGAAAALLLPPGYSRHARRVAIAAVVAESAAVKVMESRLGMLAEPYEQGEAGRYAKLAKRLTSAGAAVLALAGTRRAGALVGSGLILAGEVCLRWSVFRAGFQSARDPKYTVEPQRARVEAARP